MPECTAQSAEGRCYAINDELDPKTLPFESIQPLLELLDSKTVARLRRSSRLGNLEREAKIAELRALVLELLSETKFPFTHAAYVLGLNGSYYSYDTVAQGHYGIPEKLPSMLCRLFTLAVPDVPFTTIRMQKLAAAANFGGQHRTLAFNLAAPMQEFSLQEQQEAHGDCKQSENDAAAENEALEAKGHVLCLGDGCSGGSGEISNDLSKGSWRLLTAPALSARWVPFPRRAWLQWHWPASGDLYTISVTCAPLSHRKNLSRSERRQMIATGFVLPESDLDKCACDDSTSGDEGESDTTAGSPDAAAERDASPPPTPPSPARWQSQAHLDMARRLLGLEDVESPSVSQVEDAFRRAVRVVHPDRLGADSGDSGPADSTADAPAPAAGGSSRQATWPPGGLAARTQGWAVAQTTWARRVLKEAAANASVGGGRAEDEAPQETLMLAHP